MEFETNNEIPFRASITIAITARGSHENENAKVANPTNLATFASLLSKCIPNEMFLDLKHLAGCILFLSFFSSARILFKI